MEAPRPLPSEYEAPAENLEAQSVVPDTTDILPGLLPRTLLDRDIIRETAEQPAAESEQPTELDIEKSHEIKTDQASVTQPPEESSQQSPIHIGSLVSGILARQPGLTTKAQRDGTQPDDDDEIANKTVPIDLTQVQGPSLYRQAILVGFVCAVLLLVLLLIFMVIF